MAQNTKKLVYNEVKEISFFDELLEWNKDKSIYYWIIVLCSWLSVGLHFTIYLLQFMELLKEDLLDLSIYLQ